MQTQHELHLISGRFTAAEAEQLLTELTHTKIQHHLRRIAHHNGSEEDIKASERRIKAIEAEVRELRQFVKTTASGNGLVDIDGLITVRAVQAKSGGVND